MKKYIALSLIFCQTLNPLYFVARNTSLTGMVVLASLLVNTHNSYADAISDKGREGHLFARDLVRQFDQVNVDPVTQSVTLYPDINPNTLDMNELFPDTVPGALDNANAAYGNDPALSIESTSTIGSLSVGTDTQSRAYQSLFNSITGRPHPNMYTDPVFTKSDDILSGIDPAFLDNFQDCTVNQDISNSQEALHLQDRKTCKRVTNSGECKLFHNMAVHNASIQKDITVVVTETHPLQLLSLIGLYTLDLKTNAVSPVVGQVFGTGTVTTSVSPLLTQQDIDTICAGGATGQPVIIYSNLSPLAAGGFFLLPPILTSELANCSNNFISTLSFQSTNYSPVTRTNVFRYGGTSIVLDYDAWDMSDPNCLTNYSNTLSDGFCTPTYECTSPPDVSGCTVISGITVCPDDPVYNEILTTPLPILGVDRLCQEVTIQTSCDFNAGPMDCYTDINGVLQCPANDATQPNGCLQYEQDPSCAFVEAQCIEGAQGPSGQCYAFNEIWDCGYDVNVDNVVVTSTVDCSGPIRCLGTECTAPVEESSQDFARAVASTKAITMMQMDEDCFDPLNCEIFKGEPYECKEAVGGLVDCCEEPSGGPTLTEYMSLLSAIGEVDAAVDSMESLSLAGMDIKGAWDTMTAPADQLITTATDTFTSAVESITGSASVGETAASIGFKQSIMNGTAEWVTSQFGVDAASVLFTEVAPGQFTLGGASAWLGNMIGWAFTIYTIYQVVVLIINLLWTCEQREFELGSKRKLKSCHFIGSYCAEDIFGVCIESRDSYCCYNSPLSRIFQEQVRPILGLDFGTAKAPVCTGITAFELSGHDLSGINLDEYIAILQVTGQMPSLSNYDTIMSLDSITGTGSSLNAQGGRQNTATRTTGKIDQMGNSPDVIREQIRGDLY